MTYHFLLHLMFLQVIYHHHLFFLLNDSIYQEKLNPSSKSSVFKKVNDEKRSKICLDKVNELVPLIEKYGEKRYVVQNPPQRPLTTQELDDIYELPYMNTYHPSYESKGGVPAISEMIARPFGFLASKSSSTRGRPCVISPPATPPVWNVLIVSCVPGSPID